MNFKKLAIISTLLFSNAVFAKNEAVVLMYHRIANFENDMNTNPQNFSNQMKYLHDNNYNVITSYELIQAIKNKTQLPSKSIVITFDDGWASQKAAMKVLSNYHFPATFSLVTEYQIYKNRTYLQKEDIENYKNERFTYANHSRTHFTKDFIGNPEKDVTQSKQDLIRLTGSFTPIYVYPYGKYSKKLISVLKEQGYEGAFGVYGEPVNINRANIYDINRYLMNDKVSIDMFKKIVQKST